MIYATKPPHSTMKLLSAFATASLGTAALYAREDVVTTIVTTLPDTAATTSFLLLPLRPWLLEKLQELR